jgi:hypothetical protein
MPQILVQAFLLELVKLQPPLTLHGSKDRNVEGLGQMSRVWWQEDVFEKGKHRS